MLLGLNLDSKCCIEKRLCGNAERDKFIIAFAGEVVTNRHSAYPGLETLQSLPTGARMKYEGEGVADQARDMTAATSQAASARANATAAQAQQRSNQVAGEAEGCILASQPIL